MCLGGEDFTTVEYSEVRPEQFFFHQLKKQVWDLRMNSNS